MINETKTEPDKICPKCKGELRPKGHGLHPLHWAVDRPVCPACWMKTQPERLARQKHKEVFDAVQYPTAFRKRINDEIRALSKERDNIRRAAESEMKSLKAMVYGSIKNLSVWQRIKLCFRFNQSDLDNLIPTAK
jgi:hypothetical protein